MAILQQLWQECEDVKQMLEDSQLVLMVAFAWWWYAYYVPYILKKGKDKDGKEDKS